MRDDDVQSVTREPDEPTIQRPPGPLDLLLLPAGVLQTTLYGLALGRDREMLAYWLGVALPPDASGRTRALVTTVAFPRIESGYAYFRVLDGQMGMLTTFCAEHGVWALAQIHTHPTDEPHSEADETWPASHRPGFLSLVVPFFAQFATVRDPQWRAHERMAGGSWHMIDADARVRILPDVWVSRGG